jgi:hypothetical protein
MAIEQVSAGSAPILWSTIDQAFKVINDNFTELALSVGGGGIVDLSRLASTIAPVDDNVYDLGKLNDRWRDLYLNQFIYLGNARIGSVGSAVNLPAGSTIGNNGQLLDENYFKTFAVTGQDSIVADNATDTLTINFGTGIGITSNSLTDTITFNNTGVTSILGGNGIVVDSATGTVTIENAGVTSITGTTGQIGVNTSTGSVVLTNLGVIQLTTDPGSGIGLSSNSGIINITNLAPNIAQNVFRFISVPGQGIIEADSIVDTLTIVPGYGIEITTTPLTDTVTIELNQKIDIIGSVFADDSSLMVDAVDQRLFAAGGIVGNLTGDVIGNVTGGTVSATTLRTSETEIRLGAMPDFASPLGGPASTTVAVGAFAGEIRQNTNAIAIGYIAANEDQGDHAIAVGVNSGGQRQASFAAAFGVEAGYRDQGTRALALGYQAGAFSQGVEAVAIGKGAGHTNQPANSIVINASGANLNGTASAFYVAPIRNQTGTSGVVQYDATTKEVSYSTALGSVSGTFSGNIFTNLIDSADSSQITIVPQTQFSSNVVVDGDLILNGDNRIQASTTITMVPTLSAENSRSILEITGIPAGEGSPGIVMSTPSEYIQVGTWTMLSNGGLFSAPLSDPPDFPLVGAIYIADGVNWDPQSFSSGNPYPVFYDGNDFLPMVPTPSPSP